MCSSVVLRLYLRIEIGNKTALAAAGPAAMPSKKRCHMKVLSLALAVVFALLTGFTGNAQAGWKSGVFNTNTHDAVTVAPRRAYKKRTSNARRTTRRSTSKRRYASKSSKTRRSRGGSLRGLASYYWQPQRVAAGGWFNPNALTAAHKSLPFGTRVRVTNLRNGRSVVVRINDRGPYIRGRIIDLSRRAAGVVGMRNSGVVPVRVDILG